MYLKILAYKNLIKVVTSTQVAVRARTDNSGCLKIFKKTENKQQQKTAHFLSSRELILREEYIDIKFSAYDV
jgi:hypothetical protein